MYNASIALFGKEKLYLAGPECFYTNGYTLWDAMKKKAEYYGFGVTMPSNAQLDMSSPDLRDHAKAIFENCASCMNDSTAILVDLESFRGAEPDGGSIYELGMAYARGIRCYAYTRDKRSMVWKYQGVQLKDGQVYDREGRVLPYQDLPCAPAIVGSSKILEGDFDDCLKLLMLDIEEEYKAGVLKKRAAAKEKSAPRRRARKRPLIYLASAARYDPDGRERLVAMKKVCAEYGYDAVSPLDFVADEKVVNQDNPYEVAAQLFDRYQQHVRDCDILLADLNDFRGYEPNNDVSFECGMGYQLGKRLVGYMTDTTIMKKRIPNYGERYEYRDECGRNAENFDHPINLMFSGSMPILTGDDREFHALMAQVAAVLGDGG